MTIPVPKRFGVQNYFWKTISGRFGNGGSQISIFELINNNLPTHYYLDMEQLKYSLRSIEKYAPWVRHIYLFTNGQG